MQPARQHPTCSRHLGLVQSTRLTAEYPSLGAVPGVRDRAGHVMALLEPIRIDKRETARRVEQRISRSAGGRWRKTQGHCTDDPTGIVVDAAVSGNGVKRRHIPALPCEEAAECIAVERGSAWARESSKLAFGFLVLTAARSGEVRKPPGDEFDVDGATWTVPAEHMKANRAHRVALSKRALEVLAEAAELFDGSGPVFPGMRPGAPTERELARSCPRNWTRRGHAQVPVERPGLRRRAHPHTPRRDGGRACPHDQEQGRGSLCA